MIFYRKIFFNEGTLMYNNEMRKFINLVEGRVAKPKKRQLTESAMDNGNDFSFEITPNGNLKFKVLTEDGREILQDKNFVWSVSDMLDHEGWSGNDMLYEVSPSDIGALTDAPIVTDAVERDDEGDVISVGNVWWFPSYAVDSWEEILYNTGEVIFSKSK